MKKKGLSKLSLAFLATLLLIPASAAHGETAPAKDPVTTEINDGKPYVDVYDAQGNLLKSYSDEEIETLLQPPVDPEKLKEPEVTDGSPFANFYDENNFVVGSSEENILNAQQSALTEVYATLASVHNYGAATFSNYVWVSSGKTFYRPTSVVVNPKQKFPAMLVKVYREGTATEVGRVKIGNFTGGLNVPISSFTTYAGQYKIQFSNANTSGGTIYLNGGQVYY